MLFIKKGLFCQALNSIDEIKMLQPVASLQGLRPFLKQRVDAILELDRHHNANYAGMALMLDMTKQVYEKPYDVNILEGKYTEFYTFRNSLEYAILSTYYELEKFIISDEKKHKLQRANKKKFLLVDDLANKGWFPILSQMLYGKPNADDDIISMKNISNLEFKEIRHKLDEEIKNHKPHMILLDLRLNDEPGKIDLEQLGGYSLLKYIKSSPKYRGVPVIMFTASSKAETVKSLIRAGAEAVWTKPGLDEGLTCNDIVYRYENLLDNIDNIFNKDYTILEKLDNKIQGYESTDEVKREEVRSIFFKKINYLNYRLQLYNELEKKNLLTDVYSNIYRDCQAIYIDSNLLVSGDERYRYADLVSSFLILANLTGNVSYSELFIDDPIKGLKIPDVKKFPKVVVMNPVYDEIIKMAKIEKYNLRSLRASLSLVVLKSLFESKKIRTEYFCDIYNNEVHNKLQIPKENVYADGYILDEIATVLLGQKIAVFNIKII